MSKEKPKEELPEEIAKAFTKKELEGDIPYAVARRIYLCNGRWRQHHSIFFTNIKTGAKTQKPLLFLYGAGCSLSFGVAGRSKTSNVTTLERFKHFVCMPQRFGELSDEQLKKMIADIIEVAKNNSKGNIYVIPKSVLQNFETKTNKKQWVISTSSPSIEFDWKNRGFINRILKALGSPLRILAKSDEIVTKYSITYD